mgnify:CR=1 FL=1
MAKCLVMWHRCIGLTLFALLWPSVSLSAQAFSIAPDKVNELAGTWHFYPGQLLTGFDLSLAEIAPPAPAEPLSVTVPSDWNNYTLPHQNGRVFGSNGAGTYSTWLENLESGEHYAIRLNFAGSSHQIFIGDEAQPLCAAGKPALNAAEHVPDYRHVLCRFNATANRMRLTVQVANFLHAAGGLRNAPVVGKEPIIWRDYLVHSTAAVAGLAFLFGVVTLLLLSFFLNRKQYRSLYAIGFAAVMVIQAFNGDVRLGRELFESYGFLPQAKLNMFMLPFGAAMLLLYLSTWFDEGRVRRMTRLGGIVLVGWSIVFIGVPLAITAQLYYLNLRITAILAVTVLPLMFYALKTRQKETWILAVGSGFLVLGSLSAVLRTLHLLQVQGLEFLGFMMFLATETSHGIVEFTRIRRDQQSLVKEDKAALSRLSLFVPRVHLNKVSRRWHEAIRPGNFYHTEVCVMFLRIEPGNAQDISADDLFNLHADFAEEVANFAHRSGGVVDRISVGRYILSFNDDPAIAMQLAVQLRSQVRQWGAVLNRYILFRSGIHYGPAVWGLYGSPERWAGGYMGDTINVAARLETLCARYRTAILMSQDAYFRSAHFDEYLTRMLEPVKLKGKDEHIFVYEVLAGLPDEHLALVKETLPAFGRGLQAFLNKGFARAIEYFEKVIAMNPQDFAANLYLNRSRKLLEQGTDETWNPIEALQKK